MTMKLDDIDRRILRALQRNGRIPNNELAQAVGLSPSPCLRRVRLLEEAERPVWLGASVDLGPGVERVYPRELGALGGGVEPDARHAPTVTRVTVDAWKLCSRGSIASRAAVMPPTWCRRRAVTTRAPVVRSP